jgi:hypothetical protein
MYGPRIAADPVFAAYLESQYLPKSLRGHVASAKGGAWSAPVTTDDASIVSSSVKPEVIDYEAKLAKGGVLEAEVKETLREVDEQARIERSREVCVVPRVLCESVRASVTQIHTITQTAL